MKEERKHEIEDIIDNALTEEDCRAWAEGNCTEHVKQLMEEHHIKQLNIWDDVSEIVDFDSDESGNVFDAGCPVNVEVEKEVDMKSRITKIEEIVGIKFPTGLIDKSVRGVNNFIDVHVETEDKKIYSVNYIGNWAGYYLGHNYFVNRVPIKDIVAIHKNGSRYEV